MQVYTLHSLIASGGLLKCYFCVCVCVCVCVGMVGFECSPVWRRMAD